MKKRGKKYVEAQKKVEKGKLYPLAEAIALLTETSTVKFDASSEIHFNLNADPKYADQIVRSTVALPHGTGKKVRVVAIVGDDKIEEATKAGAVRAGNQDLIEEINKGFLEFDIAIATPDMMRDLAKVAKVLGPKGMMPNPKSGTVTTEIAKTIQELQAGKVEFKTDKFGIIHASFGKVSFGKEKLLENVIAFIKAVSAAKPTGIKGVYMKTLSLTTTMGPAIGVDISDAVSAK
ncbi:MAG: 50S ribosomal protein L1 [Candidatus Gracilibacteria bacterium]